MKSTFDPVIPAEPQTAQPEVASTPSSAVVPRQTMAPSIYVDTDEAQGEFDREDVEKSYLTIVAKTGELSNQFTPGDLLINQEFVIGGVKTPIELVAMGIKKRFQQDLDYDTYPNQDAVVVDKAVEVVNAGGIVGYRPNADKLATHYYKKILQVLFLVKRPESISPDAASLFIYTVAGVDYAIVGYTARTKSAFNGIAKPLITALSSKGSVRTRTYRLSVKGETWENKSWMQPTLRVTGETSPEVLEFITGYNK